MSALKHLYPSIEPFDSFELDVGEGHVLSNNVAHQVGFQL